MASNNGRVIPGGSPLLEPRNQAQVKAQRLWPECDVLLFTGESGGGKSHCALALACDDLVNKRVREVLLFRPLVTADEEMGFLPGGVDEKLDPYFLPVPPILRKLGLDDEQRRRVRRLTLGHLRGCTFEDCVAIADESQNMTLSQLRLFLTRLGPRSKVVLCGDPEQSDLRSNAFMKVVNALRGLAGVGVVSFHGQGENLRHPLIPQILKRLG